jgi:hypothetical protein
VTVTLFVKDICEIEFSYIWSGYGRLHYGHILTKWLTYFADCSVVLFPIEIAPYNVAYKTTRFQNTKNACSERKSGSYLLKAFIHMFWKQAVNV